MSRICREHNLFRKCRYLLSSLDLLHPFFLVPHSGSCRQKPKVFEATNFFSFEVCLPFTESLVFPFLFISSVSQSFWLFLLRQRRGGGKDLGASCEGNFRGAVIGDAQRNRAENQYHFLTSFTIIRVFSMPSQHLKDTS